MSQDIANLFVLILCLSPPALASMKAMNLYNTGNYTGAISIPNKDLVLDQYNIRILLDLGLSYDNIGNHSQALIYYNKVLRQDGHDLVTIGAALEQLRNFTAAIPYFREALKTNQSNACLDGRALWV